MHRDSEVIFVKQIKAGFEKHSNLDAWVARYFNSSPPLIIPQTTYCFDDFIERVISVEFEFGGRAWVAIAFTEPEDELYHAAANNKNPRWTMDQLIESYVSDGWELLGYGVHPRHACK